jgi:hypothetical protein
MLLSFCYVHVIYVTGFKQFHNTLVIFNQHACILLQNIEEILDLSVLFVILLLIE